MPKKIIMTEAMFNRTKNYILQRESRVNTSLDTMQEDADKLVEAINAAYAGRFPNYCGRLEKAIRRLTDYFLERARL